MIIALKTILQQGHQVASGLSKTSPYPAGTIKMQLPFFNRLGLDLNDFYPATLNLSIAPASFKVIQADYHFKQVKWAVGFNPEDFSFIHCHVIYAAKRYPSLIYYPHPETKTQHFQSNSMIEVLAPKIANIHYGETLGLQIDDKKICLTHL